ACQGLSAAFSGCRRLAPRNGSLSARVPLEPCPRKLHDALRTVGIRQDARRLPPQLVPLPRAHQRRQEREVLANEANVRVAAVEERFHVAIDAIEAALEPVARRALVERQRLREQVLARAVDDALAGRRRVDRDAADDELGVEPIAALL